MTPQELESLRYLYAEVERLRQKVDGFKGDGIANSHNAMSIKFPRERKVILPSSAGGSDETITFLITGDATGKAIYTAKSFSSSPGDVDASADLDESDLGNLSLTNDCLVLNLPELASSNTGHDVTNSNNTNAFSLYGFGRIDQINSDGTKIVHADMRWKGCS